MDHSSSESSSLDSCRSLSTLAGVLTANTSTTSFVSCFEEETLKWRNIGIGHHFSHLDTFSDEEVLDTICCTSQNTGAQDRLRATRPFLDESDVSDDEDQTYDADEDDDYCESSDGDGPLFQTDLTAIATDDEDGFISSAAANFDRNQPLPYLNLPSSRSLVSTRGFSNGEDSMSDSGKEVFPSMFTRGQAGFASPATDRCDFLNEDQRGYCKAGSVAEDGSENTSQARTRQLLACLPLRLTMRAGVADGELCRPQTSLDPTLVKEYGEIIPGHYRDCSNSVDSSPVDLPLDVARRVPLGAYQVVRSLSVNGYTQVVAAESSTGERSPDGYGPAPSKMFAIKIYFKNRTLASSVGLPPSGRLESALQMKNEIRALKRISQYSHGSRRAEFIFVQQIDAVLEDQVRVFLIQDLRQFDLRSWMIEHSPFLTPTDRAGINKRFTAQMAVGVAALHSIGIVHRDLKPENILIDYAGNAVISDFGCAKVCKDALPLLPEQIICAEPIRYGGEFPYVAPEARNKVSFHGIQVDFWSLGCILYELENGFESLDARRIFIDDVEMDGWCAMVDWDIDELAGALQLETFSHATAKLIAKLCHPDPRFRAGFEELLFDPYFLHDDGFCEFSQLSRRALFRPSTESVEIACDRDLPVPYVPFRDLKRPEYPTWINPRGSFCPVEATSFS